MIYGANRNKGESIGDLEDAHLRIMQALEKPMKASCVECVKKGKEKYSSFVPKLQKLKL